MKITEHFDENEFVCRCGCKGLKLKRSLVERLEKLYKKMNASKIIINSGYRCPKHSVAVGGSSTDAHTMGIAADITVYKQDGTPYNVETVAFYANLLSFGGIGLMNGNSIHLDVRDEGGYLNKFWHGDERTGKNIDCSRLEHEEIQNINKPVTHKVTLIFDGHMYSGLLEED